MITRDRILAGIGHALAVVPGVFVPGVPKWVIGCAFAGALCTYLAQPPGFVSQKQEP